MNNHKFSGTPSIGWLHAHGKKYINRWAEFELVDGQFSNFLKAHDELDSSPIICRGIFAGFRKKNPSPFETLFVTPSQTVLHLEFRKVSFYQNNKQVCVEGNNIWSFTLNEIKLTGKLAEACLKIEQV